jgi:trans-aconitate methyltransferase
MTSPPALIDALGRERIAGWRDGWDAMMAGFVPGMTSCEETIFHAVEGLHGGPPNRVLDLGGGPGALVGKMAARWPGTSVTLLDVDPVLLALARADLPSGVTVHEGDLCTPAWTARTGCEFDLVTSVMTMHYLQPEQARALYREAHRVLAPGGLLIVADLMPEQSIPAIMAAFDPAVGEAVAELAWAQWWSDITQTRELEHLVQARKTIFEKNPPAEFTADTAWHLDAARAAGFAEAGVLWRCGRYAALAAVAAR